MQDALNKIVLLGLVWSPRFLNIIKIKECCFSPSNASSFLFPAKVADQNLDLSGTEQVLVLEGFFWFFGGSLFRKMPVFSCIAEKKKKTDWIIFSFLFFSKNVIS